MKLEAIDELKINRKFDRNSVNAVNSKLMYRLTKALLKYNGTPNTTVILMMRFGSDV